MRFLRSIHPSVRPSVHRRGERFQLREACGFRNFEAGIWFRKRERNENKTTSQQRNKQTNKSANRQTKRGMRSLPSRLLVCWKVVTCRLQEWHENRFCNLPLDISKENRHLINCLMSICVILFPFNRTGRWVTSSPPSVSLSLSLSPLLLIGYKKNWSRVAGGKTQIEIEVDKSIW